MDRTIGPALSRRNATRTRPPRAHGPRVGRESRAAANGTSVEPSSVVLGSAYTLPLRKSTSKAYDGSPGYIVDVQ